MSTTLTLQAVHVHTNKASLELQLTSSRLWGTVPGDKQLLTHGDATVVSLVENNYRVYDKELRRLW